MVNPKALVPCMHCGREYYTESYEELLDGVWTTMYESTFCSESCEKDFKKKMNVSD